jgi:hypothetical protein
MQRQIYANPKKEGLRYVVVCVETDIPEKGERGKWQEEKESDLLYCVY